MSNHEIEFVVPQSRIHTGGGLRRAFREAKTTGLPVQHMNPNGTVTVCYFNDNGRRRQFTRRNVRVLWGQ